MCPTFFIVMSTYCSSLFVCLLCLVPNNPIFNGMFHIILHNALGIKSTQDSTPCHCS